mmetsp:Transcript_43352/g.114356  ORF Transcript_43352/g.114356 Transcript_43352/m.114356 type:complete len:192 (-) Transcript_43352:257-832(-)
MLAAVIITRCMRWTPLHLAVRLSTVMPGRCEVIRLLLDAGADPDIGGDGLCHTLRRTSRESQVDVQRPLVTAILAGCVNSVALLLERGADPDAGTASHVTPLHAAAVCASVAGHAVACRIVALLLRWGADPSIVNAAGLRPSQNCGGEMRKVLEREERWRRRRCALLAWARGGVGLNVLGQEAVSQVVSFL